MEKEIDSSTKKFALSSPLPPTISREVDSNQTSYPRVGWYGGEGLCTQSRGFKGWLREEGQGKSLTFPDHLVVFYEHHFHFVNREWNCVRITNPSFFAFLGLLFHELKFWKKSIFIPLLCSSIVIFALTWVLGIIFISYLKRNFPHHFSCCVPCSSVNPRTFSDFPFVFSVSNLNPLKNPVVVCFHFKDFLKANTWLFLFPSQDLTP